MTTLGPLGTLRGATDTTDATAKRGFTKHALTCGFMPKSGWAWTTNTLAHLEGDQQMPPKRSTT